VVTLVCNLKPICWYILGFFYAIMPLMVPRHYRLAYDNCVVLEARICYNVAKLMYLNSERCVCVRVRVSLCVRSPIDNFKVAV